MLCCLLYADHYEEKKDIYRVRKSQSKHVKMCVSYAWNFSVYFKGTIQCKGDWCLELHLLRLNLYRSTFEMAFIYLSFLTFEHSNNMGIGKGKINDAFIAASSGGL